jgi:hypothetical protein
VIYSSLARITAKIVTTRTTGPKWARPTRGIPGGASVAGPDDRTMTEMSGCESKSKSKSRGSRSLLLQDGHVADPIAFEGGVNADYLRSVGSYLSLGLGARYQYGGGSEKPVTPFSGYQSEHIGFLPLLVGVGRRLGGTDEQIEGLAGIGPAVGSFSVAQYSAFGLGAELDFNYVRPLAAAVALVVGVSARVISFSRKVEDGAQIGTSGVHVELPVNFGLRMLL